MTERSTTAISARKRKKYPRGDRDEGGREQKGKLKVKMTARAWSDEALLDFMPGS